MGAAAWCGSFYRVRVCRVLLDSRFRGNDVTGATGMTVAGAGWMGDGE